MICGWSAIYLRELFIVRRRLLKLILSWSVQPTLYMVAFGYALGRHVQVEGHTYMEFLLPGLVAMSSMNQAYRIAREINFARFYWHIFEEFQVAPISNTAFVLGEVLAGMTRALMAVGVILILGAGFGVVLSHNLYFWLALILNSFVFASLAVIVAMVVRAHDDQGMLNNFIITPMAFLGGTFFPLEQLPILAQKILYFLPLTHASKAIRAAAFGQPPDPRSFLILAGVGIFFFVAAVHCVNLARD
ncbi:MAG: ABC transporter permease [Pseudomonadota bacterium]|nr:ABC transporter permease [Pseudomonadota bacterium]